MTAKYIDAVPGLWANENPMGRVAKSHEIRGAVTWLASNASTFCTGSK